MPMSGVQVAEDVKSKIQFVSSNISSQKQSHLGACLLTFSKDEKQIVCSAELPRDYRWDDLRDKMVEMGAAYVIAKILYADGTNNLDKVAFITWVPETTKIKTKMLMASSKEAVKQAAGTCTPLEIQDASELTPASIMSELKISGNVTTFCGVSMT